MFQVATSHEDEISREESEAEFQIVDKDASATSETPACMKRRPLSRRVQPIPVGGCQAIKQQHPAMPKGWVYGMQGTEIRHLLHCLFYKRLVLSRSAWIQELKDLVDPAGK